MIISAFGDTASVCYLSTGRGGFSGTSISLNGWFSKTDTTYTPDAFISNIINPRYIADIDGDGCGDISKSILK